MLVAKATNIGVFFFLNYAIQQRILTKFDNMYLSVSNHDGHVIVGS